MAKLVQAAGGVDLGYANILSGQTPITLAGHRNMSATVLLFFFNRLEFSLSFLYNLYKCVFCLTNIDTVFFFRYLIAVTI